MSIFVQQTNLPYLKAIVGGKIKGALSEISKVMNAKNVKLVQFGVNVPV